MGVPWAVQAVIVYTVGGMVLLPLQAVVLAYDTVVLLKKAAKYTSKGIYFVKHWNANRRARQLNALSRPEPEPEGEWVCLGNTDKDGLPEPDRTIHLRFKKHAKATNKTFPLK